MQTARFEQLRKKALEAVFTKVKIASIWRKIVKDQLRNQDIKDLYDNYDLNFNIDERAEALRRQILQGNYRASQPLIYRLEKKMGICRHMVIPQPIDALVLQVLIEEINDEVLKNQPSEKAFFSRSRHNIPLPHDVEGYGLSTISLWKKLQKTIYGFTEEKDLLVTTDISNYYDSIDIRELHKVFLGYTKTNEVIIDLLFGVIQEISWRPDYLPYSNRGLPTSSLEAIRLLAHAFLYEIDNVIKEKTDDSFTRWMDDITIGVNSQKEAKETISSVSDMLKSRGLALNLAKTTILTKEEAITSFLIHENQFLNGITILKKTDNDYGKLIILLKKRFRMHEKNTGSRYWDKVTKRYITTFGKLESKALFPTLTTLYVKYPSLRVNIHYYLQKLGYSVDSSKRILEILNNLDVFDDISVYQICELVTKWEIPNTKISKTFLKKFGDKLSEISFERKNPSDFYSLLWFKAKYSEADDLLYFINRYQNIWKTELFLKRQVGAILTRLYITNTPAVENILKTFIASGENAIASIANQIMDFTELKSLNPKIRLYLFPEKMRGPYPLPKFFVLCSILNSPKLREDKIIQGLIKKYIRDPRFKYILKLEYGIK